MGAVFKVLIKHKLTVVDMYHEKDKYFRYRKGHIY